jgi:cAMP phosphodiesterase
MKRIDWLSEAVWGSFMIFHAETVKETALLVGEDEEQCERAKKDAFDDFWRILDKIIREEKKKNREGRLS